MTSIDKRSDSVDGEIQGQDSSHATARTSAASADASNSQMEIGQTFHDSTYFNSRGAVRFLISAIPLGSTIVNAQLQLTAQSDFSVTNFNVEIVPISNDYFPIATYAEEIYDEILAAALDVIWRSTSGMALATPYTSPNLDVAHIQNAVDNELVYVSYGIRSSRDSGNNTPTGDELIDLFCKNNGVIAYEPHLLIEYTENGRTRRATILGV